MHDTVTHFENDHLSEYLQWVQEFVLQSVGPDIMLSKYPPPSPFIQAVSASKTFLDEMFTGGAPVQEVVREFADDWVHLSGLSAEYEKFWKERHGEGGVTLEHFEDERIQDFNDNLSANQHGAACSLFHDLLASKLEVVSFQLWLHICFYALSSLGSPGAVRKHRV